MLQCFQQTIPSHVLSCLFIRRRSVCPFDTIVGSDDSLSTMHDDDIIWIPLRQQLYQMVPIDRIVWQSAGTVYGWMSVCHDRDQMVGA
jgi:hypothetical protein